MYLKRTSRLGSAEAIKAAEAAKNSELIMLYNALPKVGRARTRSASNLPQRPRPLSNCAPIPTCAAPPTGPPSLLSSSSLPPAVSAVSRSWRTRSTL